MAGPRPARPIRAGCRAMSAAGRTRGHAGHRAPSPTIRPNRPVSYNNMDKWRGVSRPVHGRQDAGEPLIDTGQAAVTRRGREPADKRPVHGGSRHLGSAATGTAPEPRRARAAGAGPPARSAPRPACAVPPDRGVGAGGSASHADETARAAGPAQRRAPAPMTARCSADSAAELATSAAIRRGVRPPKPAKPVTARSQPGRMRPVSSRCSSSSSCGVTSPRKASVRCRVSSGTGRPGRSACTSTRASCMSSGSGMARKARNGLRQPARAAAVGAPVAASAPPCPHYAEGHVRGARGCRPGNRVLGDKLRPNGGLFSQQEGHAPVLVEPFQDTEGTIHQPSSRAMAARPRSTRGVRHRPARVLCAYLS